MGILFYYRYFFIQQVPGCSSFYFILLFRTTTQSKSKSCSVSRLLFLYNTFDGVRVVHFFTCVFVFVVVVVLFVFVLCAQCCQFLWIVYSWLTLRFSLAFILYCVLCAQCCQFLWIVHSWSPLQFSLAFILYCVLCAQCCQFLWIVHSWLTLRFSLAFILYWFIIHQYNSIYCLVRKDHTNIFIKTKVNLLRYS